MTRGASWCWTVPTGPRRLGCSEDETALELARGVPIACAMSPRAIHGALGAGKLFWLVAIGFVAAAVRFGESAPNRGDSARAGELVRDALVAAVFAFYAAFQLGLIAVTAGDASGEEEDGAVFHSTNVLFWMLRASASPAGSCSRRAGSR